MLLSPNNVVDFLRTLPINRKTKSVARGRGSQVKETFTGVRKCAYESTLFMKSLAEMTLVFKHHLSVVLLMRSRLNHVELAVCHTRTIHSLKYR